MTIVYRSTDESAPAMTLAAGSFNAVLKACLVDGYGGKEAAGWAYTTIDAATHQALFTQGGKAGRENRHLYSKDDAAYPGTSSCWCCSACTVSATPTLTERFWASNSDWVGYVTKADQENGAPAAWVIIANARSVVVMTKRSNWGTRGWSFSFFGDIESGYTSDKGCFAAMGHHYNDGVIAVGGGPRAWCNGKIAVFGDPSGGYRRVAYTQYKALGDTAIATQEAPSGLDGGRLRVIPTIAADSYKYRGTVPFIWQPLPYLGAMPWYAIPDASEIETPDGAVTLQYFQFSSTDGRSLLVEVEGFSTP